jgi:hypothetical protein
VTSTPLVGLGFAEVSARAYAESRDEEEEDLSTGEISYESSSEIPGSDETSFDDDLAGDSIRQLTLVVRRSNLRPAIIWPSQQPTR